MASFNGKQFSKTVPILTINNLPNINQNNEMIGLKPSLSTKDLNLNNQRPLTPKQTSTTTLNNLSNMAKQRLPPLTVVVGGNNNSSTSLKNNVCLF